MPFDAIKLQLNNNLINARNDGIVKHDDLACQLQLNHIRPAAKGTK